MDAQYCSVVLFSVWHKLVLHKLEVWKYNCTKSQRVACRVSLSLSLLSCSHVNNLPTVVVAWQQDSQLLNSCRSGLVRTWLTAVWEDPGLNLIAGSCLYSLGYGLHALTAVPRSTQLSTSCGTVKWVSSFKLGNNNKWQWWMWMPAACSWTHSPSQLAAILYSCIHQMMGELSQWLATIAAP